MKGALGIALALLLAALMLPAAVPASGQSAPAFATTSLTESGIRQAVFSGFTSVAVNYTSHLSGSILALVYLDLVNSTSGQTAYSGIGTCTLPSGQVSECVVAIPPTVRTGVYTASVFAVTTDNVPISATATLQIAA